MDLTAPWPTDIEGARKLQYELAKMVNISPLRKAPRLVAAADASYRRGKVIGVAVLYSFPGLQHLDDSVCVIAASFPYIPGYLTFREGPAAAEAIGSLRESPDLLIYDGQGIAHPRGIGIASHLGVLLGMPSIGCAKSRLVGQYREPGRVKGSMTPLVHEDKQVGVVLRSKSDVKPLFVSPGHLVDIPGAADLVLACTGRFRLPEPLRHAHAITQRAKKCYNK